MVDFLSIPKNQTGYYVLALLMCLFIVFPVSVPHELGSLVDTNLGKIVVVIIVKDRKKVLKKKVKRKKSKRKK